MCGRCIVQNQMDLMQYYVITESKFKKQIFIKVEWVDYSDSSEEQQNSEENTFKIIPSAPKNTQKVEQKQSTIPENIPIQPYSLQQQKNKLQTFRQNRQIWITLQSDDQTLLDKKAMDYRSMVGEDINYVFMNKEIKGAWDLKVKFQIVETWINDGIDPDRKINIIVLDKNKPMNRERNDRYKNGEQAERGQRRERGDRGGRGDRGDRRGRGGHRDRGDGQRGERGERGERGGRGERRGRGRGDGQGGRNREGEEGQRKGKRTYVDKNTGLAPCNKKEVEQQVLQEKQRHYSKTEAEKVGLQLGNFRNKAKVQGKPQQQVKRVEQPKHTEWKKPREEKPKQVAMWTRKTKQQKKQQQLQTHEQKPKPEQQPAKNGKKYEQRRGDKAQGERKEKVQYKQKTREEGEEKVERKPKKYVRLDEITEQEKKSIKENNLAKVEPMLEEDH